MGIRGRFITVLCGLGLAAIVLLSLGSYLLAVHDAREEAVRKVELLFYYQKACLDYFRDVQAPLVTELVEQDRFYPELMSEFAASRLIHENFRSYVPGVRVKYASINPLNPDNRADGREAEIIGRLARGEGDDGIIEGFAETEKGRIFYWAQGLTVTESCLRCHGDPVEAPKDQVMIYGDSHGYGWKTGEIAGAFFVYLPMDEILAGARTRAIQLFGAGLVILLVFIAVVGTFLDKSVVRPIIELSSRAEEISIGERLEEKVEYPRKDEIGALAKSINRLRISIVKMQKFLQG